MGQESNEQNLSLRYTNMSLRREESKERQLLHVICTRLRPGHFSVRVGGSSRRNEEIVKISNCAFECDHYSNDNHHYHHHHDPDHDDDDDHHRHHHVIITSAAHSPILPDDPAVHGTTGCCEEDVQGLIQNNYSTFHLYISLSYAERSAYAWGREVDRFRFFKNAKYGEHSHPGPLPQVTRPPVRWDGNNLSESGGLRPPAVPSTWTKTSITQAWGLGWAF